MRRKLLDFHVPLFLGKRLGEPGIHVLLAFCLFCFSIPFESIRVGEGGLVSVSRVTGALLFLAAITSPRLCFKRPNAVVGWAFAWFYLLVFALMLVSDTHMDEAALRVSTLFQMMFAVWISSNLVQYPRFLNSAIWSLGVGSFFLSLLPHVGFGGVLTRISDQRVAAEGFDPNFFASSIVIGCVAMVALTQGRGKKWWAAAIAWTLTLASAYMVVKSGSRGALLSLLIGLSVISLAKDTVLRTMVRVSAVVAMILVVIILVLASPTMRARFERTIQHGDLASRQYLYGNAWKMIRDRPYFGWGPVEDEYELYNRETVNDHYNFVDHAENRAVQPHNMFIGLVTTQGLVGAIPVLVALGLAFKGAWRARGTSMGIVPLAVLTCAMSYNMTFQGLSMKVTWLPIAIAAGAYGVTVKPRKRVEAQWNMLSPSAQAGALRP